MATEINDTQFEEKVQKSEGLVLVDFWAPWCAPCRILTPSIEKLSEEKGDKMKIYKVNVDESPQTAAKFGIMSIPTLMWFKDGKKVQDSLGAIPYEVLLQKTEELLGE